MPKKQQTNDVDVNDDCGDMAHLQVYDLPANCAGYKRLGVRPCVMTAIATKTTQK